MRNSVSVSRRRDVQKFLERLSKCTEGVATALNSGSDLEDKSYYDTAMDRFKLGMVFLAKTFDAPQYTTWKDINLSSVKAEAADEDEWGRRRGDSSTGNRGRTRHCERGGGGRRCCASGGNGRSGGAS